LSSGRDSRPGQNSPGAQAVQLPGEPTLPGPQPAQAELAASAALSLAKAAHASGRSGGGQVSGTQPSSPVGAAAADAGCVPAAQDKPPRMHCEAEKAPRVAVVEPAAQAAQAAMAVAPVPSLKRPSGQSVGAAAPAAGAYFPGGAGAQAAAPGVEEKPAAQGAQEDSDVAPTSALEVPAGQLAQAADVWPGAGLYVPAAQGAHAWPAEAPPTTLPYEPGAHTEAHDTEPLAGVKEARAQGVQEGAPDDEKEPGAQGAGASAPKGQAEPGGHRVAPKGVAQK
jgi:hypothetical protein